MFAIKHSMNLVTKYFRRGFDRCSDTSCPLLENQRQSSTFLLNKLCANVKRSLFCGTDEGAVTPKKTKCGNLFFSSAAIQIIDRRPRTY